MIPVFDYDKGANFKLKVKQTSVTGFKKPVPNYDASTFAESSAISLNGKPLTDEQLEDIDKQIYKLQYLVDPKLYKSSDQLCAIYEDKMGKKISGTSSKTTESFNESSEAPQFVKSAVASTPAPSVSSDDDESDDDFFARLKGG